MSRLPQKAAEYAAKAMTREIRAQIIRTGITQAQLGKKSGLSQGTVSTRIRDPGQLTIREFNAFNKELKLSPALLLDMCGYTRREVREALGRADPGAGSGDRIEVPGIYGQRDPKRTESK